MVTYRLDSANRSPLTAAQKRELAALAALPDSEIDYSDIPPLTEAFWQNAVPNPYFKPVKQSTTVRIDADVLAWLRAQGRGYQTRINAILRSEMLKAQTGMGKRWVG
ncbi:MAG: BrnA antitoxin family protein [Luteimonas sp.]